MDNINYATKRSELNVKIANLDLAHADCSGIRKLILEHSPIIRAQIEGNHTALRTNLLELSRRMTIEPQFNTNEGRILAFEVMGIALGTFSEEEKPEWKYLPQDVNCLVFKNFASRIMPGCKNVKKTSRQWCSAATEVENMWVRDLGFNLKTFYKTKEKAIPVAIKYNFPNLDLSDFDDLTNQDLAKVFHGINKIKSLDIMSEHITELPEQLYFLKKLVCRCKNLKKLPDDLPVIVELFLSNCESIEKIPSYKNLQRLKLVNCVKLTDLQPSEKVTSIYVARCPGLSREKLEELFPNSKSDFRFE